MDEKLKLQLMQSIFRFKRVLNSGLGIGEPKNQKGVNMTELLLMNAIVDNTENPEDNVDLSEVREYLSISKGAVSQMLGSLEKKGFISRDIDKSNRRKIIITLTADGRKILERQYNEFSERLEEIIDRLGEDDTRQMIQIVNRMIDITNELEVPGKEADIP